MVKWQSLFLKWFPLLKCVFIQWNDVSDRQTIKKEERKETRWRSSTRKWFSWKEAEEKAEATRSDTCLWRRRRRLCQENQEEEKEVEEEWADDRRFIARSVPCACNVHAVVNIVHIFCIVVGVENMPTKQYVFKTDVCFSFFRCGQLFSSVAVDWNLPEAVARPCLCLGV